MTVFNQSDNREMDFQNLDITLDFIDSKNFVDCTFSDCNLQEVTFQSCAFQDCHFIKCDLSLVKLPQSHFRNTVFTDCRMLGINWCLADWETQSLLSKKRVDFENCVIDHSLFIGMDLSNVKIQTCIAKHVDFEGANLSGTDFSGTDLEAARFVNCDLTQSNFSRAKNYTINAGQNKLHKTHFSLPEAISLLHCLDIILDEER